MIEITNDETYGWEAAIRGMRNPMNSWNKSDSYDHSPMMDEDDFEEYKQDGSISPLAKYCSDPLSLHNTMFVIGDNDLSLMKKLAKAGTDHRKFMRMITVSCDITAPLYWWKEFDTYKVGTVANSCSTMHKIQAKEFTIDDFSREHLDDSATQGFGIRDGLTGEYSGIDISSVGVLQFICDVLNMCRYRYLETKDKKYWWQMIQLLPSSYNQKRTVMLNYEVLANIYKSRRNHKLDEWHTFCDWIENLPYPALITGKEE